MAKKGKRNIADFQAALLKNTKVIKDQTADETPEPAESLAISSELAGQLRQMAEKYGVESPDELANLAIRHFLQLEEYWFKDEETHAN